MAKAGFVAVLTLMLLASRGNAQNIPAANPQAPPEQKTESPSIVTSVDEVTVDMVVHDKKNEAVLDLKPGDITITDSGSAVKLSDLRLITGQSAAHQITLVFGRLEPSAAKNARDIAGKILKMVPPKQFSFAVLKVEGRLRLYQEFTSDPGTVNKAVEAATEMREGATTAEDGAALPEKNLIAAAQTGTDSSGTHVSVQERSSARVMLAALEESQKIVQDQHCRPWLAGLLAIARAEHKIAGRKVVIYFEQAAQLDSDAKDMLLNIAGEANRSGVSIYTVDANAIDEQAGEGLIASAAIAGAAPGINASAHANSSQPTGSTAAPQLPAGMQAQI